MSFRKFSGNLSSNGRFLIPVQQEDVNVNIQTALEPLYASIGPSSSSYDAVVGSASDVTAKKATHSSIAAAVSAVSAGGQILILQGEYSESLTITKPISLVGKGVNSLITGSLTFQLEASHSIIEKLRVKGSIVLNGNNNSLAHLFLDLSVSSVLTDNGVNNKKTNIVEYNAAPSSLAYSSLTASYTKGTAITTNTPSSSGGAVVSYSVSPALPVGLSLNTSTGVISGTPTALSALTTHTITATNLGGSTTKQLSITVNDVAPSALSYSTLTAGYTQGTAITVNSPTSSGGAVVSYSVSPALPVGLTLNTSTGVISGTPTVASAATTYTVTATNSGGSVSKVISIAVATSALTFTVQHYGSETILTFNEPVVISANSHLKLVTAHNNVIQWDSITPSSNFFISGDGFYARAEAWSRSEANSKLQNLNLFGFETNNINIKLEQAIVQEPGQPNVVRIIRTYMDMPEAQGFVSTTLLPGFVTTSSGKTNASTSIQLKEDFYWYS